MRKSIVRLRNIRPYRRRPSIKVAVVNRSATARWTRTINKTEAYFQAECVQCHSEVLHVAEKRHPVSYIANTSNG